MKSLAAKLSLLVVSLLAWTPNWCQVSTDIPNANKTGLPEGGSFAGEMENINLANGNVNVNLPLLKLPGIAGFDFNLSLLIDSRMVTMGGDQAPQDQSDGSIAYSPPWLRTNPAIGGLSFAGGRLSIPTLNWTGIGMSFYIPGGMGGPVYGSVSCLGGFVFTDQSGAMHGFKNFPPCQFIQPYTIVNIDDAKDGSLLRLDTTNTNDKIVTDRSGIQYHFNTSSGVPFKINDLNGNAILISASGSYSNQTIVITDTEKRKVTITPGDIAYRDSSGAMRHILATQYAAPPTSINISLDGCRSRDAARQYQPQVVHYGGYEQRWVIQMPTQESYTLDYDAMLELTKIVYPSGGYTQYDYQNEPASYEDDYWSCSYESRQIVKRHVCARSSGSCSSSQEAVTTYTPTPGGTDSNTSVDIEDPLGNHTLHSFVLAQAGEGYSGTSPVESDVSYKQADGTELRKVHTDYVLPENTCATSPQPTKITTTWKGNGTSVSSYVSLQYQTVWLRDFRQSNNKPCPDGRLSMTDNVTVREEHGFDEALLRTTSQDWSSGSPEGSHILDRLVSRTISADGFSATHSWSYDGNGNLTSETVGGSSATDATTSYGRDSYGRLTSVTDPNQNGSDGSKTTTTYDYTPSWNGADCSPSISAFPTSITNKLGQTSTMTYNPCTGTINRKVDPNDQTTTFSYDAIGRTTGISNPDGGGTKVAYEPGPGGLKQTTTYMDGRAIVVEEDHDGLGRVIQTRNTSTSEGTTYTDTDYDVRGLVSSVSNPYTGSKTGVVSFGYDALGRRRFQFNQDHVAGSSCTGLGSSCRETSYAGNVTSDYDELRNLTKRQTDALGRLTDVWEPDSSGSATIHTQYAYAADDDLLSVSQAGTGSESTRSRAFKYDGRGQLLYSSNPETGVICYGHGDGTTTGCQNDGYDLNGNLLYKTDARSRTTSYSYDALNRLVSTAFSDGVTGSVCYSYDTTSVPNSVGRLSAKWTKKGACEASVPTTGVLTKTVIASYDAMGRIKSQSSCVYSRCTQTHTQSYTYDYLGHETSYVDGRGVKFMRSYDAAGRFQEIDNLAGSQPVPLLQIRTNSPQGWTEALQGTGIRLCKSYDSRMRTIGMTADSSANPCQ